MIFKPTRGRPNARITPENYFLNNPARDVHLTGSLKFDDRFECDEVEEPEIDPKISIERKSDFQ